ncbi:MAG: nicotinate (nicotinamide) nucleotide adenylyltransferase [Gemmatimonadaceae bacterium]|nr:nicotinate (nicotinamide) nucleotide adenylyltransferase [Gemmatimonadaceae bacterium]
MRLGIFGGSFDPPHLGHLLPAIDAAEALALGEVRFVPAAQQPFKVGQSIASADHRLRMTELLVQGSTGLVADRSEVDRAGLSFMVDTLSQMAATRPGTELVLLLGADAYALFDSWRDPERIRQLASIAVLSRGEVPPETMRAGVQVLRSRRVDISSTELRARVANGRSIRGFVPDAVAEYIAEHRLYM